MNQRLLYLKCLSCFYLFSFLACVCTVSVTSILVSLNRKFTSITLWERLYHLYCSQKILVVLIKSIVHFNESPSLTMWAFCCNPQTQNHRATAQLLWNETEEEKERMVACRYHAFSSKICKFYFYSSCDIAQEYLNCK